MKLTALAGGTGAAKLLRGLCRVIDPRDLTVIVNTGDDAEIWGLHISPDLDTVSYTLGGVIDESLVSNRTERPRCREHMICPLPRASEMSAFRVGGHTAMVMGGDHALCRGRRGAGHEGAAGHHASTEWGDQLGASRGDPRPR